MEEEEHNHYVKNKGTHTTSAFHYDCKGCQIALKKLMGIVKNDRH